MGCCENGDRHPRRRRAPSTRPRCREPLVFAPRARTGTVRRRRQTLQPLLFFALWAEPTTMYPQPTRGDVMRKLSAVFVVAIAIAASVFTAMMVLPVEGQTRPQADSSFAAVPGARGGSDLFGPYEPVADWPK